MACQCNRAFPAAAASFTAASVSVASWASTGASVTTCGSKRRGNYDQLLAVLYALCPRSADCLAVGTLGSSRLAIRHALHRVFEMATSGEQAADGARDENNEHDSVR